MAKLLIVWRETFRKSGSFFVIAAFEQDFKKAWFPKFYIDKVNLVIVEILSSRDFVKVECSLIPICGDDIKGGSQRE